MGIDRKKAFLQNELRPERRPEQVEGPHFCSGWDLNRIGRMYAIADVKPGERVKRAP